MIKKLDSQMNCIEISVLGTKKAECLDFEDAKTMGRKINELVDAVNHIKEEYDIRFAEIEKRLSEHDQEIDDCARDISKMEKIETPAENVQEDTEGRPENVQDHKTRSTNERLRKALDVAIETLRDIKNDPNTNDENTELLAYRLEQIKELTKGE